MTEIERPQDKLERHTKSYLESLKLGEVIEQPQGVGKFPDFSVNGRIAVEVTLLVAPPSDGAHNSPDTDLPSLTQSVKNVIEGVKMVHYERTRYVDVHFFSMPDQRGKKPILNALKTFLNRCADEGIREVRNHELCKDVEVDIFVGGKRCRPFLQGGVTGDHMAGWLVEDLLSQCQHAVLRKEKKLEKFAGHYQEYWLAVGSAFSVGLPKAAFSQFVGSFDVRTNFSKLILIDGNRPENAKEVVLPLDNGNTPS
ncbi:hypothetical protein PH7735_01416 [Shimia thalassica]|uniref:Uncharacterized protein n=1 Tax=Shimia thalassica TaxID=1715693 RepID=A0A0P1I5W7_9RHOB|nr:hypothetical protein [Shimia thalassica]CUJ91850.1 hypothetical protein PH7735_01416 [Shimia thalassica]